LFAIELIPVCSPAYLAKIQPIERPAQLLEHTLLHSMKRPDDWQIWLEAAGIRPRDVHAGLTFGSSVLAYQAAIDGAGITMAHTQMVGEDISSGRLAAAFPLIVQSGDSYHLTFRQADAERPDVKAFRSWALDEARAAANALAVFAEARPS
jgi:LysR family glycine cleavage system transcriptional activator